MRRFLTTLMILLVVMVAGFSALVMLVNPNDFRAYMVQQVAARSGYQLQLDGPLRWHVWPQLSILSGRMALTAEGASEPLVRADNMRLDVALWPLLSHQLKVEQVMLKGAVIQLTPQTEAARREDAPVAPKDNTLRMSRKTVAGLLISAAYALLTACWCSSMKTTSKLRFAIFACKWSRMNSIAGRLIFPGG
ncbi:putative assembly protein [Citrobacter koseri]|uniref:Putative assembly protein n=1 Tax=Citrobacter koseri TaxID=545 RepID=A0A2X2VQH5_CITKO|nr:putative assembly protein [Citrobacter koseri]